MSHSGWFLRHLSRDQSEETPGGRELASGYHRRGLGILERGLGNKEPRRAWGRCRTAQKATSERRNVLRSLRAIYDKRHAYELSVHEWLMTEIRDHAVHTTRQLKNWLAINEPAFHISFRRAKKAVIAGMKSIRHYFMGTYKLRRMRE